MLDAQTRLAPNWTLKGRVVSMRAKTHEVDVWPYRENYGLAADTCDNTAGLNRLCRYYFYVRPEGRVKLDQATIDLMGDLQLGGLQHKLLAEIDHYRTKKTGRSSTSLRSLRWTCSTRCSAAHRRWTPVSRCRWTITVSGPA